MLPHGGGSTPVTQTPDTHLNQHVRRKYTAKEGAELIRLMREKGGVPRVGEECSIDFMHEIMKDPVLHLQAAHGYLETGAKAELESSRLDCFIVKEAGDIWKRQNMREKIKGEVARIRVEASHGRLRWTLEDVQSLIHKYPRHKDDDVLERIEHEQKFDEEDEFENTPAMASKKERLPKEIVASESDCGEDDESEWPWSGEEVEDESESEAPATDADASAAEADASAAVAAESPVAVEETGGVILTEEQSSRLERSVELLDVYQRSLKDLNRLGAVKAVGAIQNEIHKEERRLRGVARENPAILDAMAELRDKNAEEDMKRRRMVTSTNILERKKQDLEDEICEAKEKLAKQRANLKDMQDIIETAVAVKRFPPATLGAGHAKGGTIAARKARFELMDRIAHLGSGLSAEQRNEWTWFKEQWDKKMCEEHKGAWGTVFAGWMQHVLDELRVANNAMSLFVFDETRRCLDGELGVAV